jgi:2-polyprenyl-3-methyl-5-hydroxy-6-metoxy-1,4-benzoquinol methylase
MSAMTATKEQSFWDNWNLERIEEGPGEVRLSLTDTVVSEVRKLNLAPGSSLLDVAVGAGWTTERLYRDFEYLGLDLAGASIDATKQRIPDADLEAADFLEWQEPHAHYDLVVCVDAVAYFRDQDLAISKMYRALKPGGWLVISTLNPFVYSRLSWVGPPGEGQVRKWLTRSQFKDLLERNGFDVLRSRTILPTGDHGIWRLINGRKIRKTLSVVGLDAPYEHLKESIGLGQFRVVVARKAWELAREYQVHGTEARSPRSASLDRSAT